MADKKSFWKYVRIILLNKYTFVLVLFFGYLTFFDQHSLIKRQKTKSEIKKLELEYEGHVVEIEKNKEMIYRLKNDSLFLEKFAREKYYMKRDNEDVFIFKNNTIENEN
jgi:cell division protein DivIC